MGWVLEQRARLEPGRVARIPDGSRLLGEFGHAILEDMLLGSKALDLTGTTPERAAEWAGRAFDERVEGEAAPLVLPGRDVERAIARRLVCEAAAALVGMLKESGWRPLAAEKDLQGDLGDTQVHGRVDLIVERAGAPGIIDLKLGNAKRRREELEKGRAVQLALYSAMLRRGGAYPPTGYFVLEDGQLLTTTPEAFARATAIDGPSTHETVEDVKKGLAYWKRVLATGVVPSTREELEGWREPVEAAAGEPLPEEGAAEPQPGCRFCKFETLCAARLAPEATP
jgi:RecB family exonuclease